MNGHTLFRYTALGAFFLTYVTILLGGNVMASGSGLGCSTWPSCNGSFLPPLVGASGIEWSHRLAAGFLSIAVFFLAAVAYRYEAARPVLRRLSYSAAVLVVAQALLGGLVVESDLAVGIVLLHFFLATVLFGLLLLLAALANLRDVPRRWLDWAWRASDDAPQPAAPEYPAGVPVGPDPSPAAPFGRPEP